MALFSIHFIYTRRIFFAAVSVNIYLKNNVVKININVANVSQWEIYVFLPLLIEHTKFSTRLLYSTPI